MATVNEWIVRDYFETLMMMRGNGVDGVLSFRTMRLELVDHLDTSKNYEKFDLLKDAQLDLFSSSAKKW